MRNPNLDANGDFLASTEVEVEKALRPRGFSEFQGQQQIVENLMIFIEAAKQRGEALDHTLLHGHRVWAKQHCHTSLLMR